MRRGFIAVIALATQVWTAGACSVSRKAPDGSIVQVNFRCPLGNHHEAEAIAEMIARRATAGRDRPLARLPAPALQVLAR